MWREIQKTSITSIDALVELLELDRGALTDRGNFPLLVPRRLVEKMEKGNLNDPLLRQFVPLKEEEENPLGFVDDPVEDRSFCQTPRLLTKYRGRALLVSTSACAMHCRYCFRQNFPYEKGGMFEEELRVLNDDTSIEEVIMSGGDPLSLSDRMLEGFIGALGDHIRIVRFHSRFPVGIPERVDEGFLALLEGCEKQVVFVLHVNHERELDEDVVAAMKAIQRLGIPVLMQTVLLKGVNDSVDALKALCMKGAESGILPYYLHQLDRVRGTAHFEVNVEDGLRLVEELRGQVPGYACPRYVQEIPGESSKTELHPGEGLQAENREAGFEDASGRFAEEQAALLLR